MALTLARPEGNPAGGKGLALFYLETRDESGGLNGILVHRLKDKLGTRKVPTAELTLDGAVATPVAGLAGGVKSIAPMLNITRTWNGVSSIAYMRRAIALARDYARRRHAFGAPLADKPLHLDTLAGLQAEFEAAFHLVFHLVELIGREEAGVLRPPEQDLLRLLTPVVKLTAGKQVVGVCSEALECFGGAGYVEDTGLPALLRDAQVLSIWEGTTNVLALETQRAAAAGAATQALTELLGELSASVQEARLVTLAAAARQAVYRACRWLESAAADSAEEGARRYALTLGRSLALALLARHAQWVLAGSGDQRPLAAALRFAAHGVDLLGGEAPFASRALAMDE
jgi:hypothetical protein